MTAPQAPRPVRRPRKAPPIEPPSPPQEAHETICLPVSIWRFRVLFADGVLVDFLAARDTSDIRQDMLDAHYGKRPAKDRHNDPSYRIEGVAHLGAEYVHMPTPASRHDPS